MMWSWLRAWGRRAVGAGDGMVALVSPWLANVIWTINRSFLLLARESGLRRAMRIAFRAGGVAGMFTVGLGLLGATVILIIFKQDATTVRA